MLAFHTASGLLALATGLGVLLMHKGTPRHRLIGGVYTAAMIALCGSSFFVEGDILPLVGRFGIFHAFALFGLAELVAGISVALFRSRFGDWYAWHLYFMLWSFVGLVMATGSHFFRYVVPFFHEQVGLSLFASFGAAGLLLWGMPAVVGTVWIERLKAFYRKRPDALPEGIAGVPAERAPSPAAAKAAAESAEGTTPA